MVNRSWKNIFNQQKLQFSYSCSFISIFDLTQLNYIDQQNSLVESLSQVDNIISLMLLLAKRKKTYLLSIFYLFST